MKTVLDINSNLIANAMKNSFVLWSWNLEAHVAIETSQFLQYHWNV